MKQPKHMGKRYPDTVCDIGQYYTEEVAWLSPQKLLRLIHEGKTHIRTGNGISQPSAWFLIERDKVRIAYGQNNTYFFCLVTLPEFRVCVVTGFDDYRKARSIAKYIAESCLPLARKRSEIIEKWMMGWDGNVPPPSST